MHAKHTEIRDMCSQCWICVGPIYSTKM